MPSWDYKRIIFAILLVLISVGMLFGIVWLIFIRPGSEPAATNVEVVGGLPGGNLPGVGEGAGTQVQPGGGLLPENASTVGPGGDMAELAAEVAHGSLTKVSGVVSEEINNMSFEDGGVQYLSGEDDKFYRVTENGDQVALSNEAFPFVSDVTWSPDGEKVILEYPDGANIIYDFTRNTKVTLPPGMEDPQFDQSSDNIAYKYFGSSENDNWLVVSNTDNSAAKAIEPMGANGDKVEVSWSPNSTVAALFHESVGLNQEEVFFIGQNGENYKSVVVNGSGFEGVWSPDGKRVLYSVIDANNGYNPALWIVNASGDNIGLNNFNLGLSTWVDKCVFAGDGRYVYCAVPANLPEGAGIYPDLLNDQPDVFYQVDLNTGISSLIAIPVLDEEHTAFQVKKIFEDGATGKLYFWDGFTNKLYAMRLR